MTLPPFPSLCITEQGKRTYSFLLCGLHFVLGETFVSQNGESHLFFVHLQHMDYCVLVLKIPWPSSSQASFSQLSTGILVYCDHLVFPDMLLPATHVLWPSTKNLLAEESGCCVSLHDSICRQRTNMECCTLCAGILPAFCRHRSNRSGCRSLSVHSDAGFSMLVGNTLSRHMKNACYGDCSSLFSTQSKARESFHTGNPTSLSLCQSSRSP